MSGVVQRKCSQCGFQWAISKLEAKEKPGMQRKFSEGQGSFGTSFGRRKTRARKSMIYEAAVAKNQRVIANNTCAQCGTYGQYVDPSRVTQSSERKAAWYVDPNNTHQFRYWDGTRWTDDFAPR